MSQEVADNGSGVGCPVLLAHVEHLLVDAAVGRPVADDAEDRPRDAAPLAELGDGGGLHVERHHAPGSQPGDVIEVGEQDVGRPHRAVRHGPAEGRGAKLGARGAVDDHLGDDERADRRLVLDGARDADDDHSLDAHGVQQVGGGLGGQLRPHAGDDGDDLAVAQ